MTGCIDDARPFNPWRSGCSKLENHDIVCCRVVVVVASPPGVYKIYCHSLTHSHVHTVCMLRCVRTNRIANPPEPNDRLTATRPRCMQQRTADTDDDDDDDYVDSQERNELNGSDCGRNRATGQTPVGDGIARMPARSCRAAERRREALPTTCDVVCGEMSTRASVARMGRMRRRVGTHARLLRHAMPTTSGG